MKGMYQTILVSLALLFCVQAAHAAPMPNATDNFGYVDIGSLAAGDSTSASLNLNDAGEFAFWFEFQLASVADVSLNTLGSESLDANGESFSTMDSILALFAADGSLIADDLGNTQNDDCSVGVVTSCQSFSSLAAGSYIAGVTTKSISAASILFAAMWELQTAPFTDIFDETAKLNIAVSAPSAVPVPAAFWLFGTALIGFVGMSRRTTVKA